MEKMKVYYEKYHIVLERYLYPLILFLYPLITFNQGVDVSDSTYSLGNYLYFGRMEGMWVISTYLSNAVGSLLVRLPGGGSLLMMNLYTGLFVSALALICYYLLKKEFTPLIVFAGEIIAIGLCWIPTGILYNYMTYLLFGVGALLLYFGVSKNKSVYLFFAGIALGANVMVRFPNLTQAALIVAVWYGCYIYGRTKDILKSTGICLLGYVAGFGIPFLAVAIQYGFGAYADMINSLMGIQQTDATYSPFSMITSVIDAYVRSAKWIGIILVGVLLGCVMFSIAKERFIIIKKVLYLMGIALMLRFFWGRGMFSFRYYEDYTSMFEWGMVLLYMALIVSILAIFGKHHDKKERLMAVIVLVVVGITPLGSNNYTCQNLNNLFVVAPFTLYCIWNEWKRMGDTANSKRLYAYGFPVKSMIVVLLLMIVIQSIGFHGTFVFRDGMRGEKRDTKITQAGSLEGIYTNQENAQELTDLLIYCEENNLTGQAAVFYGDAPGLSYILRMPFAISTSWPDLDSYGMDAFERELMALEDSIVIMQNTKPVTTLAEEKLELLQDYLVARHYNPVYESDRFTILQNIE